MKIFKRFFMLFMAFSLSKQSLNAPPKTSVILYEHAEYVANYIAELVKNGLKTKFNQATHQAEERKKQEKEAANSAEKSQKKYEELKANFDNTNNELDILKKNTQPQSKIINILTKEYEDTFNKQDELIKMYEKKHNYSYEWTAIQGAIISLYQKNSTATLSEVQKEELINEAINLVKEAKNADEQNRIFYISETDNLKGYYFEHMTKKRELKQKIEKYQNKKPTQQEIDEMKKEIKEYIEKKEKEAQTTKYKLNTAKDEKQQIEAKAKKADITAKLMKSWAEYEDVVMNANQAILNAFRTDADLNQLIPQADKIFKLIIESDKSIQNLLLKASWNDFGDNIRNIDITKEIIQIKNTVSESVVNFANSFPGNGETEFTELTAKTALDVIKAFIDKMEPELTNHTPPVAVAAAAVAPANNSVSVSVSDSETDNTLGIDTSSDAATAIPAAIPAAANDSGGDSETDNTLGIDISSYAIHATPAATGSGGGTKTDNEAYILNIESAAATPTSNNKQTAKQTARWADFKDIAILEADTDTDTDTDTVMTPDRAAALFADLEDAKKARLDGIAKFERAKLAAEKNASNAVAETPAPNSPINSTNDENNGDTPAIVKKSNPQSDKLNLTISYFIVRKNVFINLTGMVNKNLQPNCALSFGFFQKLGEKYYFGVGIQISSAFQKAHGVIFVGNPYGKLSASIGKNRSYQLTLSATVYSNKISVGFAYLNK